MSIHFCADEKTIETVFRTIVSVNQLSIHGAVAELCEEYGFSRASTGKLVTVETSDPSFAPANILTMTSTSSIEIPAQEDLWQKHRIRMEKLPQDDQLSKVCTDAGFLKIVEVSQYFMTKHTDEFSESAEPGTCRE